MENISITNNHPKVLFINHSSLEVMDSGRMDSAWNILTFFLTFQESNTFQHFFYLSVFISFYPLAKKQFSASFLKKKIQIRNLPVHDGVSVNFLLCLHELGA